MLPEILDSNADVIIIIRKYNHNKGPTGFPSPIEKSSECILMADFNRFPGYKQKACERFLDSASFNF